MPPPRKPFKKPFKKGGSAQDQVSEEEQLLRTPVPKGNQSFGIVEQRVGGSRMLVRCMDGKARNCRIPGRLKKKLWVREGNLVVVEPWEFGGDDKGDVILKYRPNQVDYLRKKGYLRKLDEFEEF